MKAEQKKEGIDPKTGLRSHAAPIIERAPLPLIELQGDSHFVTYVNAAFCKLLGQPREQLLGKPFDSIVPGGGECVPLLDQVYKTGEPVTHVQLDHKEPAHWLYAIWPALDEKERPVGVIVQMTKSAAFRQNTVAINEALLISGLRQHELTEEAENLNEQLKNEIAERKEAEKALRESEERFRIAVGIVSNLIWTNNAEGFMVGEQPGWADFTGQTHEAYQGYGWSEAVHPQDVQPTIDAWKQAVAEKRLFKFEHRLRRRDGAWRLCSLRAVPLFNGDGTVREWVGVHTDITERKEAEAELRESEQRFRALTLASSDAVYRMNADWSQMIQLNGKDFLADTTNPLADWLNVYIYADDHAHVTTVIRQVIKNKSVFELEHRVRRADGSLGWTFSRAVPLLDDQGEIREWFGAATDITERRQTELDLRQSEERYRTLFTSIDEGFCIIEVIFDKQDKPIDYRFLEVNPTFSIQTGLRDVVGKRMRELVPEIEAHWIEIYGKVALTGEPIRFTNEAKAMDGRWFDAYACRVGTLANWKVAVVFNDITERRRQTKALSESEERYRNLFNSMDEGYCILEMIFDESEQPVDYRILEVNPAFEKQSGMHEATGKRMLEFVASIEKHWLENYARVVRTGEPMRFADEYKALGSWFDVYAFRVGGPGSLKVAALFNNITERKSSETEMVRIRDLAVAASRAKDDFLAALSHDLRTPLSPVLLLASESAANEKLPVGVRHTFEIIAKNIAVEAQLIDDLLDVTRITQNKLSLNMQPVDVHILLRSAVETVQADVNFKHLKLTLDLVAGPCMVLGDAVRLQQIFWNLLRNSVKFTPQGGTIRLATQFQDASIIIEVCDSGIGLNPAEAERVFQAFSQGDHAGKTGSHQFGGLGLGLAISDKLAQLHGGKISVASEGRGKGATFTVTLPQLTEQQLLAVYVDLKKPLADLGVSYPDGQRILLVEDHEPTRAALAFLLTRRHYDVVVAASVAEARELAAKNTIHFVISDIGLPDGTGYELMTELREVHGLKGIAMTGYGMEEDVARSKKAGFVTHLTKPVHIHALTNALSNPELQMKNEK